MIEYHFVSFFVMNICYLIDISFASINWFYCYYLSNISLIILYSSELSLYDYYIFILYLLSGYNGILSQLSFDSIIRLKWSAKRILYLTKMISNYLIWFFEIFDMQLIWINLEYKNFDWDSIFDLNNLSFSDIMIYFIFYNLSDEILLIINIEFIFFNIIDYKIIFYDIFIFSISFNLISFEIIIDLFDIFIIRILYWSSETISQNI